ncbi:MAG TPA: hypothetical protein VNO14_01510 [Blastocatellia bacterium]|nr:hypothetical protein [Blastocatellia bacterium]
MKRGLLKLLTLAGAISFITLIKGRPNNEKEIEVEISDGPVRGAVVKRVNPYSLTVKKNRQKVRWNVKNDSGIPVNVIIDGFYRTTPPDPAKSHPFGPDDADNRFDFETIRPGDGSRLISKTGKGEGPPDLHETYKYTIKVRWEPAGEFTMDPHVVFID